MSHIEIKSRIDALTPDAGLQHVPAKAGQAEEFHTLVRRSDMHAAIEAVLGARSTAAQPADPSMVQEFRATGLTGPEAVAAARGLAGLQDSAARAAAQPADQTCWQLAETIADVPAVHEALQAFSEDATGDNGTAVVCAVMTATHRPTPAAAQPVEPARIAALEARTGMFTLQEAANAKTGEWLCIRFNTFEDRTAAWRAINGQNVAVPPGAAASGDSTPPSAPADASEVVRKLRDALRRLLDSDPTGSIATATDAELRSAVDDDAADPVVREQAAAVLQGRMALSSVQGDPSGAPRAEPEAVGQDCHGLDTPERVRFYEHDFYVLSNFSAFRLEWKGSTFDTSEAAYHCEKFAVQSEPWWAIIGASSAHEAFKIAEAQKHLRRQDWDDVKVDIMRDILRAKATQHEYVRRKLLATGDRYLVEDSWRDDFWGWGPNRDGKNMLGRLWMEVRAEFRAAEPPQAASVERGD